MKRRVTAYHCPQGRVFLHRHESCPHCRGRLSEFPVRSTAVLVSHTTVHVNPTGHPIRLGVAQVRPGLRTLCVVQGEIRGNGRDRITLVRRDGRFVALARAARLDGVR